MLGIRDNFTTIQDAARSFRRSWTSLALWSLIFKTLSVAIVAPLSAVLINRVVALSGNAAISNYEMRSLLTNPLAIILVLMIIVVSIGISFGEQAGQLLIAHAAAQHKKLRVRDAVLQVVNRMIPLLRLAAVVVGLLLLFGLPIIAILGLAFRQLMGTQDINYYLEERPSEFYQFATIAGVAALAAGIIVTGVCLRLCLVVPGIMLHQRTAREALRWSWQRTRGKMGRLLSLFLLWFFASFSISFVVAIAFDALEDYVLADVRESLFELVIAIALILVTRFATTVIVAFFVGTTAVLLLYELDKRFADEPLVAPPTDSYRDLQADGNVPWYARGRTIIAGTLLVALASSFTSLAVIVAQPDFHQTKVTAHRGDVTRGPENSLTAIRYAIELGCDYVEIDVQETSDGQIVLSHDQDFLRVAGERRKVWELTLAEVKQLDIGSRFSNELTGEQVPTLKEVFEVTRNKIILNIELKPTPQQPQLADRVVRLIQAENFQQNCVISSLNLQALERVRELDPTIRLVANISASVGKLTQVNVDALSINQSNLDRTSIERFQDRGYEVHVGTVNQTAAMQRFLELGVDNILTDKPAELLALTKELESLDTVQRTLLRFRVVLAE